MKLHNSTATCFIPDAKPMPEAAQRITHLGIGAHQDDLEFMAFHGIQECFAQDDKWFGGVTCTNGSGSSRTGVYGSFSGERMMAIRREEQNTAAVVGRYGVMWQLGCTSSAIRNLKAPDLKGDLKQILLATCPHVVYAHNPADKHDTHVGVVVAALQAMRELPRDQQPRQVIGCEVWRNLDWLADGDKVLMDVSGHDRLAAALNGVFDSQIAGGKRYDLAIHGRRASNASFFESHATDKATQMIFGVDLTPLVKNESKDIIEYICGFIDHLKSDVRQKLSKQLGQN